MNWCLTGKLPTHGDGFWILPIKEPSLWVSCIINSVWYAMYSLYIIYHVKGHFLTQESPFLHRVFQKVRKSRQISIYRDKIAYVRAHDFRPSPNLLAKALRAFAQLLPNFDVIAWFTIFCKPICPNHYLYAKQLWWIETQPPPFDHWSAGCRASWWTEGRGGRADKAPGVWSLAAQGCSRGDQGSQPLLTDCSPLFALAAVDIWTGWPDSHRGNIRTCL